MLIYSALVSRIDIRETCFDFHSGDVEFLQLRNFKRSILFGCSFQAEIKAIFSHVTAYPFGSGVAFD